MPDFLERAPWPEPLSREEGFRGAPAEAAG